MKRTNINQIELKNLLFIRISTYGYKIIQIYKSGILQFKCTEANVIKCLVVYAKSRIGILN